MSDQTRRVWLAVEDDPSLQMLLATMLSTWGIEGLIFSDGYEAMAWLDTVEAGQERELPELALLDIRMPGPQGHEIAYRLRQVTETAGMKIVMMTAFRFDPAEHDQITKLARPDLFINKPLPDPVSLKARLDGLLVH